MCVARYVNFVSVISFFGETMPLFRLEGDKLIIAQETNVELSPNITAELNENGELIGIEILNASAFIQDAVLDTNLAKRLSLASTKIS